MSKLITKLIAAVATITFFAHCAGAKINYNNPKQVSLAFMRALCDYDIERAKLAGTKETKQVLHLLETLHDAMPETGREAQRAELEAQMKRLKKAKCEVDGEQAICNVCCDEAGDFEAEPIVLKKIDKKWLVHMTKEDLNK